MQCDWHKKLYLNNYTEKPSGREHAMLLAGSGRQSSWRLLASNSYGGKFEEDPVLGIS